MAFTQRGETFAGYTNLEVDVCVTCGVLFAAPKELLDMRHEDGNWFYCPNGHQQHFTDRKSTRLQRELDAERERAAWLAAQRDQAQASARAQKAAASRARNQRDRDRRRVAVGVCPCCNRSFKNLRRHMSSQHPDFAAAEADV